MFVPKSARPTKPLILLTEHAEGTSSTKTTAPTTTTIVDKGDTKTKKSKMPIALIGGGVLVVGIIIYFIVKN